MRTFHRVFAPMVALALIVPSAQSQSMPGSAATLATFGGAVAVTADEVIVGEPNNSRRPGTVYVYRRGGSGWAEAAQLTVPGAQPSDGFGSSIAVSGSLMLVGAASANSGRGGAHLFRKNGDAWTHVTQLTPTGETTAGQLYGARVALSADMAVVTAPGNANTPAAAYIFAREGERWVESGRIAPPADVGTGFGSSAAVHGSTVLIGAPGHNENRGAVLVFGRSASGSYENVATVTSGMLQPNDRFGTSMTLRNGTLVVSAPFSGNRAGAAYVFGIGDDGAWTQQTRLVGFDASPNFVMGAGLALTDGELWAGAPGAGGNRGSVYRFWRSADGSWSGTARLMPSQELRGGSQYGAALDARGDLAAVALPGDDFGAGSVVIYERTGGEWTERVMLKSPPEALAAVTGSEVKCSESGMAANFACSDVELMSFLPIPEMGGGRGVRLNDIWGWTDPETGKEYALVGRIDGTSFVDVSDPSNPVYVGDLPLTEGANPATWRDIKVYRDHAYVVADGSGQHGMQVLDLKRLREFRGTPLELTPDHTYRRINSAHNIVINEESGFGYAVGASSGGETCGGGLHMIDLREPASPQFAGCFSDAQTGRASTGYSHDAQCVIYRGPDQRYTGREICIGSNETALSIADVTDKSDPKALSRASYPNVGYSHQGWLTEDHRYLYMNDELDEMQGQPKTRTMIWDLADLEDPRLAAEHMGVEPSSDHNLYIRGNLMYQSNYKSGLRILDITNRESPREVGFFDTAPAGDNGPGFQGSWSNYPYFGSGIIVVSSVGEGLFVLKKRPTAPVF